MMMAHPYSTPPTSPDTLKMLSSSSHHHHVQSSSLPVVVPPPSSQTGQLVSASRTSSPTLKRQKHTHSNMMSTMVKDTQASPAPLDPEDDHGGVGVSLLPLSPASPSPSPIVKESQHILTTPASVPPPVLANTTESTTTTGSRTITPIPPRPPSQATTQRLADYEAAIAQLRAENERQMAQLRAENAALRQQLSVAVEPPSTTSSSSDDPPSPAISETPLPPVPASNRISTASLPAATTTIDPIPRPAAPAPTPTSPSLDAPILDFLLSRSRFLTPSVRRYIQTQGSTSGGGAGGGEHIMQWVEDLDALRPVLQHRAADCAWCDMLLRRFAEGAAGGGAGGGVGDSKRERTGWLKKRMRILQHGRTRAGAGPCEWCVAAGKVCGERKG